MMVRRILLPLILCLLLFQAQAAPIVSFSPNGLFTGFFFSDALEPINVPVFVSGLPAGTTVGAFDLVFQFEPAALTYNSFIFSANLGIPDVETFSIAMEEASGSVRAINISLLSEPELQAIQSSGLELGTLLFTSMTPSGTAIGVSGVLSDASGEPLLVGFTGGSVIPIPEPRTTLLLCSCLLAFAVSRRLVGR
jgi:hypothetical protein